MKSDKLKKHRREMLEEKEQEEENSETSSDNLTRVQKLNIELEKLQRQNLLIQDLMNLKDEAYFRQQILITGERISKVLERIERQLLLTTTMKDSDEDEEDEE